MARVHQKRVMRGQVAAVCGLVLAGVTLSMACRVAGNNYNGLRHYIPASFKVRGTKPGLGRRWRGDELLDLKAAYDSGMSLAKIGALFDITEGGVRNVATKEGWPPRRAPHPAPLAAFTPAQKGLYRKVRAVLGRQRAYAEAARAP